MFPEAFRSNIERHYGERGTAWLQALPQIVKRYAERWSLTVGNAFDGLSFGYVALATGADGTPCVLKLSIPEPPLEYAAALDALRLWDGKGCVLLLEADEAEGAVLLERLKPGTMLSELAAGDDDAATLIAASIMRALWQQEPPEPHRLIPLRRWFVELMEHRRRHEGPGRFSPVLLDRAVEVAGTLLATTDEPTVLHGDLYHFNVLRAEREPWLAIDPKGLVSDRAFEIAAFLRNPSPQPVTVLRRRLALLTEALALDLLRTREWCFVEAMLNACWSHDEPGFEAKLAWAELMLRL